MQVKGFSLAVTNTILKAKRDSSLRLYECYTKRWFNFCESRQCPTIYVSVAQGLEFLQLLLTEGLGYSALNTARSALSAILMLPSGSPFGSDPDVKLFMKGAYNTKPPTPKYVSTWDPAVVLSFLELWYPAQDLSLEKLTMKVIVLILLVTGQRMQIITGLDLLFMKRGPESLEFAINASGLKQGRAGYKPSTLVFRKYVTNKKLCVFHYLETYITRTALLRKDHTRVFLTTKKPFRPVSKNSVARWVKSVLQSAGVDTSTFSAGSTRSATTSKAKCLGVPVDQIMTMGGWSNPSTFTRFYDRPIAPQDVATRILNN